MALVLVGGSSLSSEEPDPKPLGLTERAGRILAQIEVALDGPPEQVADLTIGDFKLFVGGTLVTPVAIDDLCRASGPDRGIEGTPAATPTSFLFFFDQRNLTMAGRLRSLESAAAMIPQLVRGGNRGAIVSSGKRMTTFAGFATHTQPLVEALGKVRDDPMQWDEYATLEDSRYRQIALSGGRSTSGCQQARILQREEFARAESSLDLFMTALGRFADVPPPKVAIYFADTLRDEPGRHYLEAAGPSCDELSFDMRFSFKRIHEGAAAMGVTVYTVQAEGLVAPDLITFRRGLDVAARDAQSGLKVLALDTGGDAFLNGTSPERMVEKIRADSSCVYLLSLDPAPFPEDRPLGIRVAVKRKKVNVRTRSQIVIQSESSRRMAKLLAAFASNSGLEDSIPLHGGLIPIGVEDGRLRVLVQASVPATLVAEELWDLGMSLVSGSSVRAQSSSRVTVERSGTRVVLEAEMELRHGPYEIALVGLENLTDTIATGRLIGSWNARSEAVQIVPIAVVQPVEGVFVRGGDVRHEGPLVVVETEPVRRARPTALVTVVCRGGGSETLHVARKLSGVETTEFDPIELPRDAGPCMQVRDVIPAGTLTAGTFTYSLNVGGVHAERTLVAE